MSQQVAALLRPKPRDSEITTTNMNAKYGFVRVVDFQNIGVTEVVIQPTGITRDTMRVKVSLK